jgi:MFS family permease
VALSPRFEVLLAGRAIQGFGAGGIFPVASAAIGDTFPPEKRGGALGLIGAVFGLAFVIGPVLGGVLLRLGWQWLFLVNLPVAAVVVILALRVVPQRKQEKTAPFDWPGMLSLGAALAGLAFGINGIRAESFLASLTGLRVLPFLAAAAALLILFGRLERRAPDPVVRPDLLRGRQRALAMTLAGGAGIAEAGLVYVPTLAVAALGVEHSTASYLLLPLVVAMAIASPAVGRLLDRIGSRSVILTGTLLLAAGLALLGGFARSLVLFVVAGALIGLGLSSLLGAPLRYIMLAEAAPRDRSAAQGVLAVGTSVGQLVGASAVSAVAASLGGGTRGYGVAYLLVAGVCLLLFLGAWGLKGRRAEQEAAAGKAGGTGD